MECLKKYKKVNGIVTEGNADNIGTNADSFYHLFDSVGLKIIKIYGPNFPGLNYRISNDNNRSKLRRIISWGDVTWQDMQEAFYRCNNLTIENDAGAPVISNPVSMKGMFRESSIATHGNLNDWDVSKVTDMSEMFREAVNFNQDISKWNVESVKDMSYMFFRANSFNNGGNALSWGEGTRNVENMRAMFASGNRAFGEDIRDLVSDFNQDIGNWNVSAVTDMSWMFYGAISFNNGNQPMIWNTQKVELMVGMFKWAVSFDQNIGGWNLESIGTNPTLVGSMEGMFSGVSMSVANFEATLVGWDNFVQTHNKPLNVKLGVGENYYCDRGRYAIQHLEEKGWEFPRNWIDYHKGYSYCDPNKFVLSFKVNDKETIVIPTSNEETYNYKVYWGDESTLDNVTGNATHTFENAGTYNVKIEGNFPRIDFSIAEATSTRAKVRTIKNWGNIKWTSFHKAFWGCTSLKINETAGIPELTQVTDLSYMFYQCSILDDEGNIGDWNISNVTNLSNMFKKAQNFNQDLSSWDVSKITNMNAMFSEAIKFNNGGNPLNWGSKTKNVTNFTQMFHKAWAFNQPINDWDVSGAGGATLMTSMFSSAIKFNQPLTNWNVSNVTKMDNMFSLTRDFNQNLENWNVNSLKTTYWMFKEAKKYNNGGVPLNWGESAKNIKNMEGMFYSAHSFNQPITWNVSGVENFKDMFSYAVKFNQDVSNWDVSSAKNMSWMFNRAYDYNNGGNPLNWGDKTQNVTNMALMFYEIPVFNQPITWNMSKVTNMDAMLKGCTSFNQDISSWNTSNILYMTSVFYDATAFNQDISSWNVSKVQSMQNLFRGAEAFDQDISNWDVSSVYYMNDMFKDAKLSTENYDKLLMSWSQKVRNNSNQSFHGGNSTYCNQTARDDWEAKGWRIYDGGQETNCSLSIDDETINKVKIFPNPFSTTAKINLNILEDNTSIKIFNVQGKLVKLFKNIKGSVVEIDREGLSDGIYFMQILDGKKSFVFEKLIIR